jgi:Ca2+-binding EF-hand superfamily protein
MERLMPNLALLTTMEFSNRTYWTALEELQRHWLSSRARLSRREGTEREQLSSMMRSDAPKQHLRAPSNSSATVPVSEPTYVATEHDGRRDATASKRAVPTVSELFKLSDVHAQGRVTLAAVAGALRILSLPFNLQLLPQHFKAAQMRRADRMHRTEGSLSYTEFCEVCEASALLTGHVKASALKAETEGASSHRTGPSKHSLSASVAVNTPNLNDQNPVYVPSDPEQAKPASRRLVSPKRNRDQSESSNSDSGLPLHHHIATLSVPSARPAAADLSEEQRRQCEAMFRRADKDDDGYLTRDELQRLLRRCGLLDDDSLTQEDFDSLLSNARALAPTNPTIERDLVDSQQFQLIMARVLRS